MKNHISASDSFPDAEAVHAYLEALPTFQKSGAVAARFGLDGIRELCNALGNPQREFRCIHVAGTNGKGSVCQMLRSVYTQAGYRTGCFTSPHLVHYNERITLNGADIPDAELLHFFQTYGKLIRRVQPSYFELATGIAFWYFARQNVDIAIIETGLGGRLDSTNIVIPELSIITSIGLDHTDILGETLEKIAVEKAGIIKKDVPVVLGNLPDQAEKVVRRIAEEQGSRIYEARALQPEYLGEGRIGLYLAASSRKFMLQTTFRQAIQCYNCAMVMQAVAALQPLFPLSFEIAAQGIETASRGTEFRARFGQLLPGLPCYFDGAHNPEAFRHALDEVEKQAAGRKKVLVFSIMRDKLNNSMLSMLSQFDEIYYFPIPSVRSVPFREIGQLLPDVRRFSDKEWLSLIARLKRMPDTASDALPSTSISQASSTFAQSARLNHIKTNSSVFVLFSGSLYFYSYVAELLARNSPG